MFIKKAGVIVGNIFFWVLSILVFAFSLGALISSAIVSGLIFMATAIIINPKFEKVLKNLKFSYKKWMTILVLVVGFVIGIINLPEKTETTDKNNVVDSDIESTQNEVENYAGESIDLNNLDNYPFGKDLKKVLSEIGVDDDVEAICEVDNSNCMTLRLTTKTRRLWINIDDYLKETREVNWIKDYDSESVIYYYIADDLHYNEPIYSYATGEILVDKVDGESQTYPLVVTVEQLVKEINADTSAAKEKYNGKWIKITGTITYISDGGAMCGYYLYGKRGDEGLKITCWIEEDMTRASVGETKTFLGIMREVTYVNNTEIGKCEIVD